MGSQCGTGIVFYFLLGNSRAFSMRDWIITLWYNLKQCPTCFLLNILSYSLGIACLVGCSSYTIRSVRHIISS